MIHLGEDELYASLKKKLKAHFLSSRIHIISLSQKKTMTSMLKIQKAARPPFLST